MLAQLQLGQGSFNRALHGGLILLPLPSGKRLSVIFDFESNTRHGREVPGFSERAVRALLGYHFPGNIRELRNVLERASILTDDGTLTADLLAAAPTPRATPGTLVTSASART